MAEKNSLEAKFTYATTSVGGRFFVLLEDQCNLDPEHPHRSITNDAERVIERLAARGLANDTIVLYQDSTGNWDELKHVNGHFVDYGCVSGETSAQAIDRVLRRVPRKRPITGV